MDVLKIKGAQAELGRSQGFVPLMLRIIGVDWPPVAIYVGDEYFKDAADAGWEFKQSIERRRRAQAVIASLNPGNK